MKDKVYSQLDLPIVNEFCTNKLLEMYVHPPTGDAEINYAAKQITLAFCS